MKLESNDNKLWRQKRRDLGTADKVQAADAKRIMEKYWAVQNVMFFNSVYNFFGNWLANENGIHLAWRRKKNGP